MNAIYLRGKLELNIKPHLRLNVLEKLILSKTSLLRFMLCQYRFYIDLILIFFLEVFKCIRFYNRTYKIL